MLFAASYSANLPAAELSHGGRLETVAWIARHNQQRKILDQVTSVDVSNMISVEKLSHYTVAKWWKWAIPRIKQSI